MIVYNPQMARACVLESFIRSPETRHGDLGVRASGFGFTDCIQGMEKANGNYQVI